MGRFHAKFPIVPRGGTLTILASNMDGSGEILKSGALTNLTELLKTLAGPAFGELGAIFADNVRVYRLQNLLRTAEKAKRILQDAGVEAKRVPSRLLLPILDACSIEDNDDLQRRWAGLLASASEKNDSLSPSFMETLKQLTPDEAKHCDYIFVEISKLYRRKLTELDAIPYEAFTKAWAAPAGASETFERLGLVRRDYDVKLEPRAWTPSSAPETEEATISDVESALDHLIAEVQYRYLFTAYALRFLAACRGPQSYVEKPLGSQADSPFSASSEL